MINFKRVHYNWSFIHNISNLLCEVYAMFIQLNGHCGWDNFFSPDKSFLNQEYSGQ